MSGDPEPKDEPKIFYSDEIMTMFGVLKKGETWLDE